MHNYRKKGTPAWVRTAAACLALSLVGPFAFANESLTGQAYQEQLLQAEKNALKRLVRDRINQGWTAMGENTTLVGKPFTIVLTESDVPVFRDRSAPLVPVLVSEVETFLAGENVPAEVTVTASGTKAAKLIITVLATLPSRL